LDGFFDSQGDVALAGTEVNTACESPTDRIAADGLADMESERREEKRIQHEEHPCHTYQEHE
jgi:hypothetical protein